MNWDLIAREFRDFYNFTFRLKRDQKSIVFYSEHKGYYAYLEPYLKGLVEKGIDGIIYISSSPNDPGLHLNHPQIRPLYSRYFLPLLFLLLDCRVAVLTVPDLNNSILHRSANAVCYVYVFHSLVSTVMAYSEKAFDAFDAVLLIGPYQANEIRKRESEKKLRKKILVPVGYPRLDQAIEKAKSMSLVNGRPPTILIAPSLNENNFLESHGREIVSRLLEANFCVRVRLHPEVLKRRPHFYENVLGAYVSNEKIIIDRNSNSDDAVLNSDVLITDFSGIALTFSFSMERPVLFLETGAQKNMQDKARQSGSEPIELALRNDIGKVLNVSDISRIASVVSSLLGESGSYKDRIRGIREQSVFNLGSSASHGVEAIYRLYSDHEK